MEHDDAGVGQFGLRLDQSLGLLGAFTTYSTYSLDALQLLQQGALGTALLYLVGTMLVCLLAVYAGLLLARMAF